MITPVRHVEVGEWSCSGLEGTYRRLWVQPALRRAEVVVVPDAHKLTPQGAVAEEWEALANPSVFLPFSVDAHWVISSDSSVNHLYQFKLHSYTAQSWIQRQGSNMINLFRYLSFRSYKLWFKVKHFSVMFIFLNNNHKHQPNNNKNTCSNATGCQL